MLDSEMFGDKMQLIHHMEQLSQELSDVAVEDQRAFKIMAGIACGCDVFYGLAHQDPEGVESFKEKTRLMIKEATKVAGLDTVEFGEMLALLGLMQLFLYGIEGIEQTNSKKGNEDNEN